MCGSDLSSSCRVAGFPIVTAITDLMARSPTPRRDLSPLLFDAFAGDPNLDRVEPILDMIFSGASCEWDAFLVGSETDSLFIDHLRSFEGDTVRTGQRVTIGTRQRRRTIGRDVDSIAGAHRCPETLPMALSAVANRAITPTSCAAVVVS